MTLVLDAGAFIALERGHRDLGQVIAVEARAGRPARTHGGVVGQMWRDGARQAGLARLLPSLEIVALDAELGRAAGALLGRTGGSDVIDAALAVITRDGDRIVTSDPDDLSELLRAAGVRADLRAI